MRKVLLTLLIIIGGKTYVYAKNISDEVINSVSGEYIGDFFTNAAGGIKTGGGYLGMGHLDLDFEFRNTSKLFIKGAFTHGALPSEKYIGDSQTASNIEAGNHVYLQEFWYRHTLNRFELTVGLQDMNETFMKNEDGDFINSSFGIPPIASDEHPFPIFPLTGLGVSGQWNINDSYSWKTVIFDGYPLPFEQNPHNLNWRFAPEDGFLVVTELQAGTTIQGKEGVYKAGAYYHSGTEQDTETGEQTSDHNYGAYFIGNLTLNKHLSLFSQLVLGSKKAHAIDTYFGFGAVYKQGEKNTLGLALAHDGAGEKNYQHETVLECFYKRTVTENISIKPDIQYIINPSGAGNKLNNALVGFVRLEINF
jgi:porin